jgi:hypothetical protein
VAHATEARREGGDDSVDSKEGDNALGGTSGPQRPNWPCVRWADFGKENQKKERKIGGLIKTHELKSKVGCRKFLSNFLKAFGFKSKNSNDFKLNLNLNQTKINLNNFFEDFSNLELLKISLNIQIQTKALNGRL